MGIVASAIYKDYDVCLGDDLAARIPDRDLERHVLCLAPVVVVDAAACRDVAFGPAQVADVHATRDPSHVVRDADLHERARDVLAKVGHGNRVHGAEMIRDAPSLLRARLAEAGLERHEARADTREVRRFQADGDREQPQPERQLADLLEKRMGPVAWCHREPLRVGAETITEPPPRVSLR